MHASELCTWFTTVSFELTDVRQNHAIASFLWDQQENWFKFVEKSKVLMRIGSKWQIYSPTVVTMGLVPSYPVTLPSVLFQYRPCFMLYRNNFRLLFITLRFCVAIGNMGVWGQYTFIPMLLDQPVIRSVLLWTREKSGDDIYKKCIIVLGTRDPSSKLSITF